MNNWTYARALRTIPWRGAMALPPDASLHSDRDDLYMRQNVAAQPEPSSTVHIVEQRDIPNGVHRLGAGPPNEPCLIEATLAPTLLREDLDGGRVDEQA